MSNELAIAATTATLRKILMDNGIKVSLMPPDTAGKDVSSEQVNLFLYNVSLDAAWRNQDMPGRVKPGEPARPPLPLDLHYLLTAYSDEVEDLKNHRLLGEAMRVFHDHPVLGKDEIQAAQVSRLNPFKVSDLEDQIERVRIVPHLLSTEEISKLWAAFQTSYRTSVAYLVSVVLIESHRGMRAPLPVLSRGQDDRGAAVLTGSLPLLAAVAPVLRLPSVRLGEDLSLTGEHLGGGTMSVVFRGPLGTGPFAPASPPVVTDGEIVARLPTSAAAGSTWPAGVYTAQVIARRTGEPDRSSGELPFLLAPRVTISPLAPPGTPPWILTVTCEPKVWPGQRVSLLVGEIEVPPDDPPLPPAPPTGTLHFTLKALATGSYAVRLRVDGVDSIPVDPAVHPPQFAADQTVVIP